MALPIQDFFLPSLLRQFRQWQEPTLAVEAADLPGLVGMDASTVPGSTVGELSSVFDVLEPTLMLLALCGYRATSLLVAGSDPNLQVAVSLPLADAMLVTKLNRAGWPMPVVLELNRTPHAPAAVVAVAVLRRSPLAVPVKAVRDGWFLFSLPPNADPSIKLFDALGSLRSVESDARSGVLEDITAVAGNASVEQLAADSGLPSGLLTMFDTTGWRVFGLVDRDQDAVAAGDPDAQALVALGARMESEIDEAGGLVSFLKSEVGVDGADPVRLRARLHEERPDRQLMRRGMRAARRRQRTEDQDRLTRAFRVGRARRLTYTEFLIGCQVEGVADLLYRLNLRDQAPRLEFTGPVFGGLAGQYVVARLQPPQQSLETVELALVNPPPAPGELHISYQRWGQQHDLVPAVDEQLLSLASGALPVPLQFADGADATPTVDAPVYPVLGDDTGAGQQVLRISGVQHGDVFLFSESVSGASVQVAVVKNFSRNDLGRLHLAGYEVSLAPPADSVGRLPETVIATIAFLLADGPGTAQERQRAALMAALTRTYPDLRNDATHAYPATLDIPSARGIGILPDDASHLHPCTAREDAALASRVKGDKAGWQHAAHTIAVPAEGPAAADPDVRAAVTAHRLAMLDELVSILTQFTGMAGATTIWHSYEAGEAARRSQYQANNGLVLWPGDPVRNIRAKLGGAPTLFKSGNVKDLGDQFTELQVAELLQVDLFVNRRAQVELFVDPVLVLDPYLPYGEILQVADALASLADGGLPPTGVLTAPGGSQGGGTGSGQTGSVRLRVINDATTVLPHAVVKISGVATSTVTTGADGSVALTDQAPGTYTASCHGYPGHQPGTVSFQVNTVTAANVLLTLAQTPPDPALPPLRATISEATGFFVRTAAGRSKPILGKCYYQVLDVTVLEAVEIVEKNQPPIWYRVLFNVADFDRLVTEYEAYLVYLEDTDPAGAAQQSARHAQAMATHQGTEAWVREDGIEMLATPWPYFLDQLAGFEETYEDESLLTRLSRLRQIGEEPDLPGNQTVGAGGDVPNQVNRADRHPVPGTWSLLLEAKQVEFADGEVIDIHHFILGVESLIDDGRRSGDRYVFIYGVPVPIGESYSAATWSGDIGGAVGELVRHKSRDWEDAAVLGRTPDELREFYLRTRAPETDLLGDIDAWGAYDLLTFPGDPAPPLLPVESLVDLVTRVYGAAGASATDQAFSRGLNRAKGIRALLVHYGFASTTGLGSQSAAVGLVDAQALIFAKTWWQGKAPTLPEKAIPPLGGDLDELTTESAELTTMFLAWLEDLTRQYGVVL